jgi:hypothetical protein
MYSVILSKPNMFSCRRRVRSLTSTPHPTDSEPNNSMATLNTTTTNNVNQIDILIICKLEITFFSRR